MHSNSVNSTLIDNSVSSEKKKKQQFQGRIRITKNETCQLLLLLLFFVYSSIRLHNEQKIITRVVNVIVYFGKLNSLDDFVICVNVFFPFFFVRGVSISKARSFSAPIIHLYIYNYIYKYCCIMIILFVCCFFFFFFFVKLSSAQCKLQTMTISNNFGEMRSRFNSCNWYSVPKFAFLPNPYIRSGSRLICVNFHPVSRSKKST